MVIIEDGLEREATEEELKMIEEHENVEKEFLYRMLYGSQKIRNEKNSADSR